MLRSVLRDKNVPLRGMAWLLRELRFADGFLGNKTNTVIDDATWHYLTGRCWAATTGTECGDAALLLSALQDWHPSRLSEIAEKATLLGRWLEEVVPESSQGLAWFLNDLSQEHRKLSEEICDNADPSRIAASVAQATWADAYAWGNLLDRLAATALHPWHARMRDAIDPRALLALADTAQPGVLWELGQLAKGIWWYLPDVALEMLERATPTIIDRINTAPAEAFVEFDDAIWFVLGYAPDFLRWRKPSPRQRKVARCIVARLQPAPIAMAISSSRRRDFANYARLLTFIEEVMPRQALAIASFLNFKSLDLTTKGMWANPPHELKELLNTLAIGTERQPARSWVERHMGEFEQMTPLLTAIAPATAVRVLHRGTPLDLDVSSGLNWSFATLAIRELAQLDKALAVRVIHDNRRGIAEGLCLRQANQCEDLNAFIQLIRDLAPSVLEEVLALIDPAVAEVNWAARLRGKTEERRAIAALVDVASSTGGPIAEVGARLRRKFPKATFHRVNPQPRLR